LYINYIVNGCWIVILFLMIKGWLFYETLTIIGIENVPNACDFSRSVPVPSP
jgi:hypothetical protein